MDAEELIQCSCLSPKNKQVWWQCVNIRNIIICLSL